MTPPAPATVRSDPYTGPSRMAVPFPSSSSAGDSEGDAPGTGATSGAAATDGSGDAGGTSSSAGGSPPSSPRRSRGVGRKVGKLALNGTIPGAGKLLGSGKKTGHKVASNGAGVVVAGLVWVWVVGPYLRGGPSETAAVLRAKFLNQTSGGTK